MAYALGPHQYGKAENRVVRIYRDSPRHVIKDVTVTTILRGDFTEAHTTGDQSRVLPTDSQKQACYAFAKNPGIDQIETYALALARHFVGTVEPVTAARITVDEHAWRRIDDHDHAWVRSGAQTRTTTVTVDGADEWVVSGVKGLALLKSTGSQFHGFLRDDFTVLEPTWDRVLATSLSAWWRHSSPATDFGAIYDDVTAVLARTFADVESLALQHSLYAMGTAALDAGPQLAEIRLSAPNAHHIRYDLALFGIENAGEVFRPDDRPYGIIQATVARDDAPPAGPAWRDFPDVPALP